MVPYAQWAAIGFGMASAVLWLWSATVPVPEVLSKVFMTTKRYAQPGSKEREDALKLQSRLNGAAAFCAAVAAFAQAAAQALSPPV